MTVKNINNTKGTIGVNGANSTNGHCNQINENNTMSGAAKLRQMLQETNNLIVCPGVYDGLSARIALSLGFEALYMVCDQVSNSAYCD